MEKPIANAELSKRIINDSENDSENNCHRKSQSLPYFFSGLSYSIPKPPIAYTVPNAVLAVHYVPLMGHPVYRTLPRR